MITAFAVALAVVATVAVHDRLQRTHAIIRRLHGSSAGSIRV